MSGFKVEAICTFHLESNVSGTRRARTAPDVLHTCVGIGRRDERRGPSEGGLNVTVTYAYGNEHNIA